jgi:hypothetical protein
MQLVGGTHFLILNRDAKGKHHVSAFSRYNEVLKHIGIGSRLSPLFPIQNAPPPPLAAAKSPHSYLVFFGPIYPGKIETEFQYSYLTMGSLNFAIFCSTRKELDEVDLILEKNNCAWEKWHIYNGTIKNISHSTTEPAQGLIGSLYEPLPSADETFVPAIRELHALLLLDLNNSYSLRQSRTDLINTYSSEAREILQDDSLSPIEKLKFVTMNNVSLSRRFWQTYGGVSPIIEMPCHFATHSLLGVGTALLGLEKAARFVESIYSQIGVTERLADLASVPPNPSPLISIEAGDTFWDTDFLHHPHISSRPQHNTEATFPHICYFSGRDGFRSTNVSLSVPFECISACSSFPWTLQTLTHEISHTQIRPLLGFLLPEPNDEANIKRLYAMCGDPSKATSLLEQIKVLLFHGMWRMDRPDGSQHFTLLEVPAVITQKIQETNELLTHIFDFMYHYSGADEPYVRSVWTTWSTIPNITNRVPQYLIRTASAIHFTNIRRDNGVQATINRLSALLEALSIAFPTSTFLKDAVIYLRVPDNAEKVRKGVSSRSELIKFASGILLSASLAGDLMKSRYSGMQLTPDEFGEVRVDNPLLFFRDCQLVKKADPVRSVWIWQHLAQME